MTLPPLRHRLPAILAVAVAAPICAEYLSAYLGSTGDAVELIGGLIIFAPLYGCAALLIREVSVRCRLGWPGRLLLAAAFGVLMPGLIDLSMFAAHSPEVPQWEAMRQPTLIPALGISAFTALSWSLGHVLMSIGAPLALADALAPRLRGRPLLGRVGIPLAAALWLLAAVFVHLDQRTAFGLELSPTQTAVVLLIAVAFVVLGLSPLGKPLSPQAALQAPASALGRPNRPAGFLRREPWILALAAGVLGMLAFDFLPLTWLGVALMIMGLATSIVVLARLSGTWGLPARVAGSLAAGAVIARTITGFLAPLPPGVAATAKYGQNAFFLAAALAVAALVAVRARPSGTLPDPDSHSPAPR